MTLEEIFEPIAPELQAVQQTLSAHLRVLIEQHPLHASQQNLLAEALTHVAKTAGKGLRPALVILSANLIRPVSAEDAVYQPLLRLAAAVELIHSASLVHDDVLDDAQFRRGRRSLNAGPAGNKIAVLVGDMLLLQAFALLTGLDLPDWRITQDIFRVLCRTTQTMCVGEIAQHHLVVADKTADVDEYVRIITRKTALLMSACCRCGALLRQPGDEALEALTAFGRDFGLAFQLADDIVDQDAPVERGVDLRPLTRAYLEQARADLRFAGRNRYARRLTALCDLLLPKDAP